MHLHAPHLFALTVLCTLAQSARADYPAGVLADAPEAYYRFNDDFTRSTLNKNVGTLGGGGDATQNLGRVHSIPGAVAGDSDRAAFFDFTSRTEIPWNAAVNPSNDKPFTIEAWFYPASDQTGVGQAPLTNRFAYSGLDRQGWVFFQRKPSADHSGTEPVGWNFRMFRGSGSSTGLDVVSGVPYQLGKWTHVVVVYDPKNVANATVSMYIDGEFAKSTTWNGGPDGVSPGYMANTDTHNPAQAIYGPAALAVGNYNNTAGTSLNPYFGGVDEFALYNKMLTASEIRDHYQNARNPQRTVAYHELVKAKEPVVYLRLNEIANDDRVVVNLGESRAAGHATHHPEVRYPAASALPGRVEDGAAAYKNRNGYSVTTVPWNAGNNPDASQPFTLSLWVKPMRDQQGGQCPVAHRSVGGTGRTGWMIFQRNPNTSYPASEGHGWVFRMFRGAGNSGSDVLTNTDYKIGEWQHLVFTWEPRFFNGDVGNNGNSQWEGILSAYVNGVFVAENPTALYSANRQVPEDGGAAADLALGAYNAKSGLGDNPFEGGIDEFAFFSNQLLSRERIAELHAAGINPTPPKNYETSVLMAAFSGPERQGPQTYFRFNDPARRSAANLGTLGNAANGSILLTENAVAGPLAPQFAGFDTANTAVEVQGTKQWVSLNQPAGLKIVGPITLEAWIKPDSSQASPARIISNGPEVMTSFASAPPTGAISQTSEVSLRIEDIPGAGPSYVIGTVLTTASGTRTVHGVSFPIPAADLAQSLWVHLAGTYDGTDWKLFRNGVQVATAASAVGAVAGATAEWAIGSAGSGWAGNFSGRIDEAAIYARALTPAQINAHFTTAITGSGPQLGGLSIVRTADGVSLIWGSGILQQSDTVAEGYVDVVGATSPHAVPIAKPRQFFRLRK
jgi:hypothetical protein